MTPSTTLFAAITAVSILALVARAVADQSPVSPAATHSKSSGSVTQPKAGPPSNQAVQAQIQNQTTSTNDLSQASQLNLQSAMQQHQQFEQTFSNIVKSNSVASNAIVGNLKNSNSNPTPKPKPKPKPKP
jgi:hypothetical protein